MSKRDLEELKNQLEQIKIRKQRDKRIVFSLPVEKYNKFLTAILLNNPLEREVDENLQKKLEELIDDFINEVDFYDLTEEDIENILNDLYKLSAIGNHFKTVKYAKLKTIYRFFYRNDKSLYHDKAITVHKAIEKGLGLSDFKSSLLINDLTDEEKNSNINFKRINFRSNVDLQITKGLSAEISLGGNFFFFIM